MTELLIIDTEGSGLFTYGPGVRATDQGQPRLASIGMVFADADLNVTAEHEFLIKPVGWTFDNDSEAAKVNGLTHERLMADGVDVKPVLEMYLAAIEAGRVIGGHNTSHDCKMMRAELRHAGLDDLFMKTRSIDTMSTSREMVDAKDKRGYRKAPRLEEMCVYFGIEQKSAHTALDDARCVLEALRHLRQRGVTPVVKNPYDKQAAPTKHVARKKALKPFSLEEDGEPTEFRLNPHADAEGEI